jgi:hypothetical protein
VRFVLPEMAAAGGGYDEWSASVVSDDRAAAWVFDGFYGFVYSNIRGSTSAVRCVGR